MDIILIYSIYFWIATIAAAFFSSFSGGFLAFLSDYRDIRKGETINTTNINGVICRFNCLVIVGYIFIHALPISTLMTSHSFDFERSVSILPSQ